jgi:serine/threonine protein kinase/tetratricopeptide (TPR) repeat protein
MSPARLEQIEQLYRLALGREPEQRSAFLDEACGDDEELKRNLELLLGEDVSGDDLLEGAASDLLADFTVAQLDAGEQIGPYRIEGLLGAGGMGEVYLAHDPRLDRRVAVKLLPERLIGDPVARERLRREALAAAALDHPFICKIFEVGEDNGALFCVMEYVRGETLFARMRAGRVPLSEVLRIAGEIAEAIEEAHANRFIHRDLKPGNVMLTVQGHVKVMDFGLAKRVARSEFDPALADAAPLSAQGTISGTPQYMSPEQLTGGTLDQRSDLFSFGVVLGELLTGRHPFRRNSPLETMTAILHDPPDLAVSDVSPGLIVLIRRLLAKSPEERYGSMGEVRADMVRLASAPGVKAERSATQHIPLIGREREKTELLRLVDAALAGHGSLVLIGGEPGIGKTHLTRAILEEAARRGCFTIAGHCYEAEGAPPYVPFIEMLEYGSRTLPRDSFRYALGDAAPEVAKLMPELRRMFPDIPPPIELPPEQQRRFLFNAYREFVERASKLTPFVAVFEDLHWADESTLLLLQHLVQTLSAMPALLIGTYRDVELDVNRPFARTLEALLREKQATHIGLRRLTPRGTEELLEQLSGQTPPPSATRILFEHTDGNPFFLESVFRHLADEGRLFDQQGAWRKGLDSGELQVPQGVRLAIGRRLERIPEEARRILTTAAVIGRAFDLRLIEEFESARPDAAMDAVEAAERARLLEAEGNSREPRYRFVHELIRQTLASSLSLPRRQRLHARVAGAIERIHAANPDAHAPAMAHHLYLAGAAADPEKTVTWLTRAAKQAAATAAFEDALAHLNNALIMLENEQSVRVAELHIERAAMLRSMGQMADAVAAFERALAIFEANGEAHRFAETCIPLAMIHLYTVTLEQALEVCRRGLASLTTPESPTRTILMYVRAIAAVLADDIDFGVSVFNELEQVQVPPHPAVIRTVSQMQTYQRFFCAQLELAEKAANETHRLSESAGDMWVQIDVAWMRAFAVIFLGRLDEGLSIAREAVPLAERIGSWATSLFCKWAIYDGRLMAGDFECAAELARVLDDYERLYFVPWGFGGKIMLANAARWRGRIEEAVELCRRANIPERNHCAGWAHAALALTLAQAADPGVSQALKAALRFVPQAGHPAPWGRWQTLNMVIEALAHAGRIEDGAALHPVAEDMIRNGYALMWGAQTLPRTTAGIAAACARNWSRAEEHHQTAIHQADTMALRVCQPIARYWYAAMLLSRDEAADRERFRSLLCEAVGMFESLGMPLYGRQGIQKLAALGE